MQVHCGEVITWWPAWRPFRLQGTRQRDQERDKPRRDKRKQTTNHLIPLRRFILFLLYLSIPFSKIPSSFSDSSLRTFLRLLAGGLPNLTCYTIARNLAAVPATLCSATTTRPYTALRFLYSYRSYWTLITTPCLKKLAATITATISPFTFTNAEPRP